MPGHLASRANAPCRYPGSLERRAGAPWGYPLHPRHHRLPMRPVPASLRDSGLVSGALERRCLAPPRRPPEPPRRGSARVLRFGVGHDRSRPGASLRPAGLHGVVVSAGGRPRPPRPWMEATAALNSGTLSRPARRRPSTSSGSVGGLQRKATGIARGGRQPPSAARRLGGALPDERLPPATSLMVRRARVAARASRWPGRASGGTPLTPASGRCRAGAVGRWGQPV